MTVAIPEPPAANDRWSAVPPWNIPVFVSSLKYQLGTVLVPAVFPIAPYEVAPYDPRYLPPALNGAASTHTVAVPIPNSFSS